MSCRPQMTNVKKRRGKLIVFLGLCFFCLYIIFFRDEVTAGRWPWPWKLFYNEEPPSTKMDFSRLWNQRLTYEQRKEGICGKEWQDDYTKLHNDILKSQRPRKFIVFSCAVEGYTCAGYGNRLGGIASLLFLSILTQRALLIEWEQEVPLEIYLVPKGIEWNYSTDNVKDLEKRTHYWGKKNSFLGGVERNDVVKQWDIKTDFENWLRKTDIQAYFDRPVESVVSNWYFADILWENPFLQQRARELRISNERPEFSLIGCAFDFLFQKSRELESRLDVARRSLGLESQVPILGLQIRMGDISFGKGSLEENLIDYRVFFDCAQAFVEALVKRRGDSLREAVKWFLATDNTAVKRYALKNYALNIVTLNITAQHLKYYTNLRTKTTSEKIEAMFGVLIDHFLLSESDFLILSNSTFGTTAAALFFHSEETWIYQGICDEKVK